MPAFPARLRSSSPVLRGAASIAVVLFVGACGARTNLTATGTTTGAATGATAADQTVTRVIAGWSDALRRGDVDGAARYFAIPSQMINANASGRPVIISIQSRHDAVLANESLPCGAKLVSVQRRGQVIDALFLLTGRPGPGGSTCAGGAGTHARTLFVIRAGRIVHWIRAPDEPGDNPTVPGPAPTAPGPSSPPGQTGPIA